VEAELMTLFDGLAKVVSVLPIPNRGACFLFPPRATLSDALSPTMLELDRTFELYLKPIPISNFWFQIHPFEIQLFSLMTRDCEFFAEMTMIKKHKDPKDTEWIFGCSALELERHHQNDAGAVRERERERCQNYNTQRQRKKRIFPQLCSASFFMLSLATSRFLSFFSRRRTNNNNNSTLTTAAYSAVFVLIASLRPLITACARCAAVFFTAASIIQWSWSEKYACVMFCLPFCRWWWRFELYRGSLSNYSFYDTAQGFFLSI
jgi:hypothetical protein